MRVEQNLLVVRSDLNSGKGHPVRHYVNVLIRRYLHRPSTVRDTG